jgi:1-acyl-sn-glycerol-3-phosphate acyltransferase
VVVAAALVVTLPLMAVAELARPGLGGRIARRVILTGAPLVGLRFDVRGAERLERSRPCVVVANHSSPLDVAALVVAHPSVAFAAATELYRYPLLSHAMRALGTIPIDRARPGAARRALLAGGLRAGSRWCLVVFAEGGMSPPGELGRFKSGPFALALEAGVPVVPVAIHNASALMPRQNRVAVRPGRVVVEVLEPLPTEGLAPSDRRALRLATRHSLAAALTARDGGHAERDDVGP